MLTSLLLWRFSSVLCVVLLLAYRQTQHRGEMYWLHLFALFHSIPSCSAVRRGERIRPVDSVSTERSCWALWCCIQDVRLPGNYNFHLQLLAVRAVWCLLGKGLREHSQEEKPKYKTLVMFRGWCCQGWNSLFHSCLVLFRKVWNQCSLKRKKTAAVRDRPRCVDRPFTHVWRSACASCVPSCPSSRRNSTRGCHGENPRATPRASA